MSMNADPVCLIWYRLDDTLATQFCVRQAPHEVQLRPAGPSSCLCQQDIDAKHPEGSHAHRCSATFCRLPLCYQLT